jgi:hypothetical protein
MSLKLEELYHHFTTEGLVKRDYSLPFEDEGIRIEHRMSSCFEGYAKIMFPWGMNTDAPNKFFKEIEVEDNYDYLFALFHSNKSKYDSFVSEINAKLEPYNIEKQAFRDSIDFQKVINWRTVRWKEVCEIYEAYYHNEISPFSFDYKFKGQKYGLCNFEQFPLSIDFDKPLLEILAKHTQSKLLIWNNNRTIEELSIQEFIAQNSKTTSMSLITKKREWMTYIEHESYCLTLGGSFDLIDDLLKCEQLEVFECTPLTRIDWHSDRINR